MKEKLLFSVIMPVYNGELYLNEAINSLFAQTYENWELIAVDDGSTDSSLEVLEAAQKKDNRIKVIHQAHSGTAGAARATALNYVNGKYVQLLDCYDLFSSDLLQSNYEVVLETQADFIVPHSLYVTDEKKVLHEWLPYNNDFSSIIDGKKAFELSLDWQIAGWGCIKTELFQKVGTNFNEWDELTTRKLFANSTKVAFSRGKYFYRKNENSVTQAKHSIKNYDRLETMLKLFDYAKQLGMNDAILRKIATDYLLAIFQHTKTYILERKYYTKKELHIGKQIIKNSFCEKRNELIDFAEKRKLFMLFSLNSFAGFYFFVLCYLFFEKIKRFIKREIKKILGIRTDLEKIKRNEQKTIRLLLKKYRGSVSSEANKTAIVMCDDTPIAKGGLCDRLRGIISVYQSCKKKHIDFRLNFTSPFNLAEFLAPNTYDWSIEKTDIQFAKTSLPVFVFSETGGATEAETQEKLISEYLCKDYNQFHFWTNAHYSLGKESFYQDFNELFKPSEKLETEIEKYLHQINSDYISVSFRFIQLLGDFKEHYNIYPVLSDNEKSILIEKCLSLLKDLYKKEAKTIFVATDSKTFLKAAQELPFVFTIPGEIAHVDATKDNSFEANKKTFIDFFMIANAEKVYLAHRGKMFYSGFPRTAALSANKPFEVIEF